MTPGLLGHKSQLANACAPRIFNIFVSKFAELSCLRRQTTSAEAKEVHKFSKEDDVELAVYYLRSLSNVFRFTPDSIWAFLAKKTIRPDSYFPSLSEISTLLSHSGVLYTKANQISRIRG